LSFGCTFLVCTCSCVKLLPVKLKSAYRGSQNVGALQNCSKKKHCCRPKLKTRFDSIYTSMACAVSTSVNSLLNRETQHVNIVSQCMYWFFEQPNMKGNHAWIEL
jgi:hypothetical protein